MTLREKRVLITCLVARLIDQAVAMGLEPAGAEWHRPQFTAEEYARRGIGSATSLHRDGLAIDLILYDDVDGDGDQDYLTDTESYRALGEWWEQQHPLCAWGGHFGDGNHFSLEHEGRK